VQATTTRPKITATADGEGVVSHAGSRLLADVADKTTLTAQLSEVLAGLRRPRARHDPGRVLVDMAVAVADGSTTICDVAVLADQAALFGAVASDSTCWQLLDRLDTARLGAIASARAAAREVVWTQRAVAWWSQRKAAAAWMASCGSYRDGGVAPLAGSRWWARTPAKVGCRNCIGPAAPARFWAWVTPGARLRP
jgi:Transposase DDE domain group 1